MNQIKNTHRKPAIMERITGFISRDNAMIPSRFKTNGQTSKLSDSENLSVPQKSFVFMCVRKVTSEEERLLCSTSTELDAEKPILQTKRQYSKDDEDKLKRFIYDDSTRKQYIQRLTQCKNNKELVNSIVFNMLSQGIISMNIPNVTLEEILKPFLTYTKGTSNGTIRKELAAMRKNMIK